MPHDLPDPVHRAPRRAVVTAAGPAGSPQRTVAVVGATGAGVTTLVEALTGPLDGPPTTLRAGLVHASGTDLVLLDVPGAPDLHAPRAAALRAADAVVLLLSAGAGIDAASVQRWHELALDGTPQLVVVSGLDRPGTDADEAVALAQRLLGDAVLPVLLPLLGENEELVGLFDVLQLRLHDWSTTSLVLREPDPEHLTMVAGLHDELVDAVLTESDEHDLVEAWLAGESLDPAELDRDLRLAVGRGHLSPVLPVDVVSGVGLVELLDLLAAVPQGHAPVVTDLDGEPTWPLTGDPDGPLCVDLLQAPDLVRVWSGTLGDLAAPRTGRAEPVEGDVVVRPEPLPVPLVARSDSTGRSRLVVSVPEAYAGSVRSALAGWVSTGEPNERERVEMTFLVDDADLPAFGTALARASQSTGFGVGTMPC